MPRGIGAIWKSRLPKTRRDARNATRSRITHHVSRITNHTSTVQSLEKPDFDGLTCLGVNARPERVGTQYTDQDDDDHDRRG